MIGVFFQALGVERYVALFVCLILDAINIYWFSKIFVGAKKLFFGAKARSSDVDLKKSCLKNGSAAFLKQSTPNLRRRIEKIGWKNGDSLKKKPCFELRAFSR